MDVVGVDGWRNGWVGITLTNGRFREAWIAADASGVLEAAGAADVIAIDIPIGLSNTGTRACDRQAKQRLGRQAARVFLTPPRPVLELEPYAVANAACQERFGFGISRQSYALRSKILQVDAVEDGRLHEVHPELAFQAMAGSPLPSKKTWAGVSARRAVLAAAGIVVGEDLGDAGAVPVDDVLDAAAAAWTAHRIGRGDAEKVPDTQELDHLGRPMAIWF